MILPFKHIFSLTAKKVFSPSESLITITAIWFKFKWEKCSSWNTERPSFHLRVWCVDSAANLPSFLSVCFFSSSRYFSPLSACSCFFLQLFLICSPTSVLLILEFLIPLFDLLSWHASKTLTSGMSSSTVQAMWYGGKGFDQPRPVQFRLTDPTNGH